MALALYRKYRSRKLDEVVGQTHVTDVLKQAVKQGRISHAYLFTGPRGVGKTSVARILAREINQLDYSGDDTVLDIIEIDAASNNSVDDIRDLRDKVHIAPVNSTYKIYIIDEVHMLSGAAFNALLKTLEEPPEHAIFILATTELHKVPATILSRTQRFHFKPASVEALTAHLKMIAGREAIDISDEALELLAIQADGSFRDGVSLLDQMSALSAKIDAQLVETTLGLAPLKLIAQLTETVLKKDTGGLLKLLGYCDEQAISPVTVAEQLIAQLSKTGRDKPELFKLVDELLSVRSSYRPMMKLTAILVDWTKPVTSRATDALVAPSVTLAASLKEAGVKQAGRSAAKVIAAKPTAAPQPDENPAPIPAAGKFDWDKVMAALKNRYLSLYSVLNRAVVDYDAEANQLNLQFAYSLHRKKLDNSRYQGQLVETINHICGFKPIIKVGLKDKPTVDNSSADSIIAIMGGGEIVDA
ncbi:MAG TPA: DNA polymerase III subunit gamma/tau [Candidatus Saccharimonadales bacterium]|nr:DNA polymerase III subunit gamma/tau [Candidatus Saccharimonadales bacterium]